MQIHNLLVIDNEVDETLSQYRSKRRCHANGNAWNRDDVLSAKIGELERSIRESSKGEALILKKAW